HDVDRGLGLVGHAIRVTFGHDVTAVVAGVHAHYVHQVGRAHGPAELFHDLVDALEVRTHADQPREAAEVREQHAVDQKARAVVALYLHVAILLGIGHGGGDDFFTLLLASDRLHQRNHVYWVEEVSADEVVLTLERLRQIGDRVGGGVGRDERTLLHRLLH